MYKVAYSLLCAADVLKSAAFYEDLLGTKPEAAFPTFASFRINDGHLLGLWAVNGMSPAPNPPGGSEVGLVVEDAAAVDRTFADWKRKGVTVLHEPMDLPFGRTFLISDPDGHRIRIFNENDPA